MLSLVIYMGVHKKVYSFRFDEELMDTIKLLSQEQNRNVSNFIETVLKEYIKAHKPEDTGDES